MHRYPLLMLGAMATLSWGIRKGCPIPFGSGSCITVAGWVLMACGLLLILVSGGFFKLRKTTWNPVKAPDKLLTTGIYAFSRNPMYLGMVTVLTGFQLVLNSVGGLPLTLLYFLYMNVKVIPDEEKRIESVFGNEYWEYRGRTRRWI